MKKVILLMTMSFLFFYGCDTEQLEENTETSIQPELKGPIGVYNFDKDGNPVEIMSMTLEEFTSSRSMKGANNQSINGHFTNQGGATTTLSVMQNPSGAHGSIKISGDFGSLRLDALCVWNEDNVGMAGGIILEKGYDVVEGFPFVPGDSNYFVYQDNGEGAKADLDQYVQAFFFVPLAAWEGTEPFGICEFLPPPSFWDTFFTTPELCGCQDPVGLKDVVNKSDQIQVK